MPPISSAFQKTSGMDIIAVTGVLDVGDEAVFRNVAAASDKAFVVLNSEGGAVKTGLESAGQLA